MKNSWLSNLTIFLFLLSVACSSGNSAKSEMAKDTVKTTLPDSLQRISADTITTITPDTVKATGAKKNPASLAKGDSAQSRSSQVQSTEKGTISHTSGAVKNPGANQAEIDSIKQAKSKKK